MQEDSNKNLTPHHFEKQDNSEIMLRDTEKNIKNGEGFILLSKVAKEKKYAQEYLGLLARRGDIGSIRIGKRWYTTWAWFGEFLENGQKKKEAVSEVQITTPVMVAETVVPLVSSIKEEPAFVPLNETGEEEIKINVPFVFPARLPARQEREKVLVAEPLINIRRAEKISGDSAKIAVAVEAKKDQMIVRKNIAVGMVDVRKIGERREIRKKIEIPPARNFRQERNSQLLPQMEPGFKNISVEEKNRYAVPYPEIKFKKKTDIFSPDLAGGEKTAAPMFSRFVFAISFAVVLLLVAASGYFVWSGGLLARGKVAGASDEKNAGFSGITSGGEYVLTSAGDKMKESLSISRVMVQAAKEKTMDNKQ